MSLTFANYCSVVTIGKERLVNHSFGDKLNITE